MVFSRANKMRVQASNHLMAYTWFAITVFCDREQKDKRQKTKKRFVLLMSFMLAICFVFRVSTAAANNNHTMETPPAKKQKLQADDSLVSSPLQEQLETKNVHGNPESDTANIDGKDSTEDVNDKEEGDYDANDVANQNSIVETEQNELQEENAATPVRVPTPESEQDAILSPLKAQEESGVPSFKQLISRFNSLVENATNDLENVPSNADVDQALTVVQFASLQNKYENSINSLNVQLHDNLGRINQLNNEISDYKQKIENMHLAIEESVVENNKLQSENEILKLEEKELNSALTNMEKQLSLEKNKSANLVNKINQLKESVEPIFAAYESLHEQLITLREQATEYQNTINHQHSKIVDFDITLKNELESLAQELYIQYAEKHEAKIGKLRAAYEAKYTQKQSLFTEKHRLLQSQYETLQQELNHVKSRLQVESSEKRHLVRLWDDYVALDKRDVDQMASFVKKLK